MLSKGDFNFPTVKLLLSSALEVGLPEVVVPKNEIKMWLTRLSGKVDEAGLCYAKFRRFTGIRRHVATGKRGDYPP